ncbi:hypothetical protein RFM68_23315 [Mesorhizobium sp. MSK_1335]|uniref:Uncharacterized protein n=1 Tax=Mesorhizobium montanum TaxID=3072323 RepID=A0ABU4ZPV6_9HYPH|nr:hypothetical protein [Mesorhizobium sp. MSK_1335]MDX8527434.1 hypothetical protein [Mesorhizobium sp. MSK_1335]
MKYVLFAISLFFLFGFGVAASYFYPGGFALAQANEGGSGNVLNIILLGVVMLLGIFASFVFAKAKTAGEQGKKISVGFGEIVTDWQFVAALFVSPLIFNSIYALTEQNPETLGDFLLSFQNGFFWQTVLGGLAVIGSKPQVNSDQN